jgi:hypothetical protein
MAYEGQRGVLEQIRGLARANRVIFTSHALQEMREAHATERDVVEALAGATRCRPSERGRWRVEGQDLDGDDLTIVVVIEDGLVVVTVF